MLPEREGIEPPGAPPFCSPATPIRNQADGAIRRADAVVDVADGYTAAGHRPRPEVGSGGSRKDVDVITEIDLHSIAATEE